MIRMLRFPAAAIMLSFLSGSLHAQMNLAKAEVANHIRTVEDGVDEFRKYLERRGDNAREAGANPQAQQAAQGRRARRGTSTSTTESRKVAATQKKDELDSALDDLNQSTNRLRRKFDATDKWIETKVQVERVVDDGRRINTAVARGNYGSEVARLWSVLRKEINDLARVYGVTPLGV
ncbi:MAG: hypothetical protein IT161_19615 [Bryobacterales bacterium]|nr:hypothetical protein [Bryobacterales bacterium]